MARVDRMVPTEIKAVDLVYIGMMQMGIEDIDEIERAACVGPSNRKRLTFLDWLVGHYYRGTTGRRYGSAARIVLEHWRDAKGKLPLFNEIQKECEQQRGWSKNDRKKIDGMSYVLLALRLGGLPIGLTGIADEIVKCPACQRGVSHVPCQSCMYLGRFPTRMTMDSLASIDREMRRSEKELAGAC